MFKAVNENLKLPIASITKIITAITVIENFDLNKVVTVSAPQPHNIPLIMHPNNNMAINFFMMFPLIFAGHKAIPCK